MRRHQLLMLNVCAVSWRTIRHRLYAVGRLNWSILSRECNNQMCVPKSLWWQRVEFKMGEWQVRTKEWSSVTKLCHDTEKRNGPNYGSGKRDGFSKYSGLADVGTWWLNEFRLDRKSLEWFPVPSWNDCESGTFSWNEKTWQRKMKQ